MELVLDMNRRYSYADYLTWMDDKRRELIDGFIRMMSPSATSKHQKVCMNISAQLYQVIEKNSGECDVFPAPFDVRLPKNGETKDTEICNVVQPDVCVVCDPSKIEEDGWCIGAPDMVVEVQSKSTSRYDLTEKFNLYETSGVREYWVVYPDDKRVEVFLLQPDGKYSQGTEYTAGKVPVHIFGNYEIDIKKIFKRVH
jgi:Uma2 family endonuclease